MKPWIAGLNWKTCKPQAMEKNIKCLITALEECGIRQQFIDRNSNFFRADINGWKYFQINKTPFNSEVEYHICRDKMHSYTLLSPVVRMPKTLSFIDFGIHDKYKKYLKTPTLEHAIEEVETAFTYPVVIKMNGGALGDNVFKCNNRDEAEAAFQEIFRDSKNYDYVALAQEYIPAVEEYRLVCAFGEPVLAYKRGNAKGFNVKYWQQGEQAQLMTDAEKIAELHAFVKPTYQELDIGYAGFDIILAEDGTYSLIEVNSSPKTDNIVDSDGERCIIDMYKRVIGLYQQHLAITAA